VKEHGVNGCQTEDVMEILIERMADAERSKKVIDAKMSEK